MRAAAVGTRSAVTATVTPPARCTAGVTQFPGSGARRPHSPGARARASAAIRAFVSASFVAAIREAHRQMLVGETSARDVEEVGLRRERARAPARHRRDDAHSRAGGEQAARLCAWRLAHHRRPAPRALAPSSRAGTRSQELPRRRIDHSERDVQDEHRNERGARVFAARCACQPRETRPNAMQLAASHAPVPQTICGRFSSWYASE